MRNQRKESVIWEGIPEMMKNKEIRESCLRRVYPCGKQTVFLESGEEISYKKFNEMFPLKLKYIEPHGQNVCRKSDIIYK